MTASVSNPYAGSPASKHTGIRIAVAVLGLATVVLGVVLLFNPVAAAKSLALLVGLAFIVGGLLEIAVGWDTRLRWVSAVLGAVLVVGGLLAIAWPDATLWAIALITGLSLLAHGVGRIALAVAMRHEVHNWGWLALAGAFGVLFGIAALAWPEATVLVLCLVLGAQITVFGLLITAAAFIPGGISSRVPAGA
ncbi:HdeD family acid-resistance protein [Blastococcus sp. URHD0036]|uniref:HdeD family acid-resistance protein n=1 Tax=Blastococcus sp. URHD0036 TaxID=1380356 RepID=UPI000495AFC1|nr:DUF308 domain-containing protein [Blastococcus sp. URHD0036]